MTTRFRRSPSAVAAPLASALLAPGAETGEWDLCRPAVGAQPAVNGRKASRQRAADAPQGPSAAESDEVAGIAPLAAGIAAVAATRQTFPTLEAAAANLLDAERFVLALPLEMGLVQRLSLPAVDSGELEEMARIQLEKILPYPADSVGMALQEVARTESEVIVAVETISYDRLIALCQPLVTRGCWPLQVVFHVRALASGAPPRETTAFLSREAGRWILGICEGSQLSFAQALGGQTVEDLASELPAVLLGAELEGIPATFTSLRLDARAGEWAPILKAALNLPVELFDVRDAALAAAAHPSADGVGDLSPAHWRAERLREEKMAALRRRLMIGVGIYLALLALAILGLGGLWLRLHLQRSRLEALRGPADYSEAANGRWQTLAPAVEPSHSLVETVWQVYDCLPTDSSVLLTALDATARGIIVQGEAPTPSAAVDFTEKLKGRPELRRYRFEAEPPAALPNGHARFRVSGTLPEPVH